jgi:hypothetical protein
MADVKVSALTALTGANLANGDQFLVTDVGSPNVSKSITADELAQGSQFSSRFVAKTDDKWLWVGANQLENQSTASYDAPTTYGGTVGNTGFWRLDASTPERVEGSIILPAHWATFHVDLYWINVSSTSGDANLSLYGRALVDGQTIDGQGLLAYSPAAYAAPTTGGEAEVTRMHTNKTAPTSGAPITFGIYRFASDASDTLTNDIGILGVRFERAS